MSIRSQKDFDALRHIGGIVRRALDRVAAEVRPGATTAELDGIGARFLDDHGAHAAPPRVYGFPGQFCISVNDEAIHGIPGDRRLEEGDIVKLDLVAEKNGYYADAAVTVPVGRVEPRAARLRDCAERAFYAGLEAARPGNRAYDIGRAVERTARADGFSVIRELCGHGVGRTIHEEPQIPNFRDPYSRARLTEGLVITIEPILSAGSGKAALQPDGWTIRTTDGALSSHFEHTVAITRGAPVLLTA